MGRYPSHFLPVLTHLEHTGLPSSHLIFLIWKSLMSVDSSQERLKRQTRARIVILSTHFTRQAPSAHNLFTWHLFRWHGYFATALKRRGTLICVSGQGRMWLPTSFQFFDMGSAAPQPQRSNLKRGSLLDTPERTPSGRMRGLDFDYVSEAPLLLLTFLEHSFVPHGIAG
jgi:hypothetical protein